MDDMDDRDDMDDSPNDTLPKPAELLALHGVAERLFDTLKEWFDVGDTVPLDVRSIDSAVRELGDPVMIAAMAMRKLQALNLIATPGVRTSTDVVITIVNDLDRALLQAPSMYLAFRAESTDWDAALVELSTDETARDAPLDVTQPDVVLEEFQVQHAALHEAVHAVVEAGRGDIRYFE